MKPAFVLGLSLLALAIVVLWPLALKSGSHMAKSLSDMWNDRKEKPAAPSKYYGIELERELKQAEIKIANLEEELLAIKTNHRVDFQ